MSKNNINGLFEALTPNAEQKDRMFREILIQSKSDDKNKARTNHATMKRSYNKRILRPILACALCLAIGLSVFPFIGNSTAFAVYAYGADIEITEQGVEISTGIIKDDGEMQGHLLEMYVTGKKIESVRFSCKNQYIDFTDWTENQQALGRRKSITVEYGNNATEYYYLRIDWNPIDTIRTLTDNHDISIVDLDTAFREDIIVLEVSFSDGTNLTKAVNIWLNDSGNITATLSDYTVSKDDDFVLNPKDPTVENKPNEDLDGKNSEDIVDVNYSEADISFAKEVAEAYYVEKLNFIITSIELDTSSWLLEQHSGDYADVIAFKVYVTVYEAPREIVLGRISENDDWKVLNEGF